MQLMIELWDEKNQTVGIINIRVSTNLWPERKILLYIRTMRFTGLIFYLGLAALTACNTAGNSFTDVQKATVRDSVKNMMEKVSKDVTHDGPIAWMNYFDSNPDFYMASGGKLVFPNYDTANNFVRNVLIKVIPKIELHWNDIHVYPISVDYADISAGFHEMQTSFDGKLTPDDGYFTALAHHTNQGWRLQNLHWSIAGK